MESSGLGLGTTREAHEYEKATDSQDSGKAENPSGGHKRARRRVDRLLVGKANALEGVDVLVQGAVIQQMYNSMHSMLNSSKVTA